MTVEPKKRLAVVEKRVPRLVVRLVSGAPDGTRVTRDGVELKHGALGESLPVNIGEHTIVVTAPGRKESVRTVRTAEGTTEDVEVTAGDPDSSSTTAPKDTARDAPHPTERNGNQALGYVLAGVGVVGLGVATVTGLSLSSKKSTMDAAHCDSTTRICSGAGLSDGAGATDAVKAASSGASLQPVFYGSLAIGILGVAAGAYFVLSADSSSGATTALRVGPQRVELGGTF